ncbi:prepilin-type N-terminal cleavage/methylation domain-containing protein [Planococcus sp. 4-30]|uniref:prepilin-type N-terminal cleavage/methylation domain-containing protein n=1 Tax=Planococcus sp. 4-30 TaxID=2874583 RepID=UPI001CBFD210|nr:prepilin-type N-terminal cleavage/methylation domain-containing protein [Planococcus sp. 4-30]
MKKYLQKKLNNEKGMTLIELLAVIVIIAIIAAIAIPAIGNIIDNSRVGTIKSDALNALSAYEMYVQDEEVASTTAVTSNDMVPDYLDGVGAFATAEDNEATADVDESAAGAFSITNGEITGEAVISGVTVSFSGASKNEINSLANNTDDGAGTANITVTR